MSTKRDAELKPLRGERWVLHDGSEVTMLEKQGDAYRTLSLNGRIVLVYPGQLARRTNAPA